VTSTGIIVAGGPQRWWAWTALRLEKGEAAGEQPQPPDVPVPVAGASAYNTFGGSATTAIQAGAIGAVHLHEGGDRRERDPDVRPWLRALWTRAEPARAVVEVRYLHEPGSTRLDAFLVIRGDHPDRSGAVDSANQLRHGLLAGMPGGVVAEPVTSDSTVRAVLSPFPPDPAGLVEIRKSLRAARTTRGDSGNPWLAAVIPWRRDAGAWEPLRRELSALPFRAMLSVGLTPYRIQPGLRKLLADRAATLARLASTGPSLTYSVYGGPQSPDQFAVHAHPLLMDAAGRYTDIAFQIRVSHAAAGPLSEQLAQLVACAISPPDNGFAGAPAAVVRPGPQERDTAWRNVTALNFDPLPAAHLQGHSPEAIGDLERTLGSLADIDEAAAAFRLP
jgi:hypothetical protein